jgi:hypothetical protein
MSRTHIRFSADDIAVVARSLRNQLSQADHTPGHVEMLNMLARTIGYRNFQAFRAQEDSAAVEATAPVAAPEPPVDPVQIQKIARFFDSQGRLVSWPARADYRTACLWVLWSKLPPGSEITEDDLNRQLRAGHLFGDHALLRRELCDRKMLARTADGRSYHRVERKPSAEGLALIRRLGTTPQAGQGGRS